MEIEQFDSIDAFFTAQQAREEAANNRCTEEQKSITWGDYFERLDSPDRYGLQIFGYIYTREEFSQLEVECGAEEDELAFELDIRDQSHSRGYRYGRCYSEWEPDGEIGSTHISVMRKITRSEFEAARDSGWKTR